MGGKGPGPTVLIDLIAAQSPSYRDRGIARYGLGSTEAMLRRHPELVAAVRGHPELPPTDQVEAVVPPERLVWSIEPDGPGELLHITSVFELDVRIHDLWPITAARRRMPLIVTVYDLIPEVFPEQYLLDSGTRRRWRCARQIVRAADHVLTISDSVTEDVARLVGVPEHRLTNVGTGCDDRFQPSRDPDGAAAAARRAIPGLRDRFVVYNGAIDPRKNVERLIEAWGLLPEAVSSRWQLVVVCATLPYQRDHYLACAERAGVPGRVVVPGFVADDVLVQLYQGADLSVFPSLYEGYGLPIVESLACGTPVIGADNSSVRELLPPELRFDGYSPLAIADAVRRALTDERLRPALAERLGRPNPTWDDVADKTAEVYRRVGAAYRRTASFRPGWSPTPRVAVVLPGDGPPTELGAGVLDALARSVSVDLYHSSPRRPGGGTSAAAVPGRVEEIGSVSALARVAPWRGGYQGIVAVSPAEGAAPLARLARLGCPLVVVTDEEPSPELPAGAQVTSLPAGADPGAHLLGLLGLSRPAPPASGRPSAA